MLTQARVGQRAKAFLTFSQVTLQHENKGRNEIEQKNHQRKINSRNEIYKYKKNKEAFVTGLKHTQTYITSNSIYRN